MTKKIISTIFLLLILSVSVFAGGNYSAKNAAEERDLITGIYPYNAVVLKDNYCYGDGNGGICDYRVNISSQNGSLSGIRIQNENDKWNASTTSNGLLYPRERQSLTNHEQTFAWFGQSLPETMPGKDFLRVAFDGFEEGMEMTSVKLGDLNSLDPSTKGGIEYTDANFFALHKIPFALELDDSESGSTFQFDNQTLWYKVEYGISQSSQNDYWIGIENQDFVNERKWTITDVNSDNNSARIEIQYYGAPQVYHVGEVIEADGVAYTLQFVAEPNRVVITADGAIEFRENNSIGTLLYNTLGDANDDTYGKLLFNEDTLFYPIQNSFPRLSLPAQSGIQVMYAVNPMKSLNRLWLVLGAQEFSVENENVMQFQGTAIANAGGTEDGNIDAYYYVPKDSDFNSSETFANSTYYFVAHFSLLKQGITKVNAFIDTADGHPLGPFPNSNLSYYSSDALVNTYGSTYVPLTTGTHETFLQKIYRDNGDRIEVNNTEFSMELAEDNNKQVEFRIGRENNEKLYSRSLHSQPGNYELDNEVLTKAQLSFLKRMQMFPLNSTLPYGIIAEEKIMVSADARMDTSSDVKDLTASIESHELGYNIDFSSPLTAQMLAQKPAMPFFGQKYRIIDFDLNSGNKFITIIPTGTKTK
ncbi:MAG: hypothetical protein ABIA76_01315 [Candidatus Diapherotrites archaeon]